jgi:hypothetical protein
LWVLSPQPLKLCDEATHLAREHRTAFNANRDCLIRLIALFPISYLELLHHSAGLWIWLEDDFLQRLRTA